MNGPTDTNLRTKRMRETRQQIVDAVIRLLETTHPAELSMPAVAIESQVSLRTLYRYFPTKAALIDETSKWMNKLAVPDSADYADLELDDAHGLLTRQWNDFDRHLTGIRAQHHSPAGRKIRKHRLEPTRDAVRSTLRELGLDIAADQEARLTDAAIAVSSSSMYLELVDRMGYDSTQAAELAIWISEAMVAHLQRTGSTRPQGFHPDRNESHD